jgi:hypothetical protein
MSLKNEKLVFSLNDYNSNEGMVVNLWGPAAWHFLHTMSFNYPVTPSHQDKVNYRNHILGLRNVLPCGKCRANLKENFKKLPLRMADMKSRETFSKYIFNLHELINTMLGKKSNLTYEEVRNTYENFRSRCTTNKNKNKTKNGKETKETLKKHNKTKKESGCTKPLYGKKAKCLLRIVPQEDKEPTFQVDKTCIKKLV